MSVEIQTFGPGERPELTGRFIDLAWRARRDDRGWVPPFQSEQRRLLSAENPFFRHGEMRCFLATSPEGDVARCAAFVDRQMAGGGGGGPMGLVGLYEAVDRREAEAAVLGAALDWLRGRSLRAAVGPVSFSIWHGYRFMIRGFDRQPFLGEPRNPRRYPEAFARAGFEVMARHFSWDLEEADLRTMCERVHARLPPGGPSLSSMGLSLRPLDLSDLHGQLRHVHRVLSEAFAEGVGYAPIDFEEFLPLYAPLGLLAVPELAPLLWSEGGEAVGFGYVFPDHARAMRELDGDDERLAAALSAGSWPPRPERLVLHTAALKPGFHHRGIFADALCTLVERGLERGFRGAVGALAREGSTAYHLVGQPSREYALFQRML